MTTSPDGIFEGNDTVTPNLVYSMTKDSVKKVCKAYSTNYGMDITIVRFFNIFQASFSSFHFISGDYARQRRDTDSFQLLEHNAAGLCVQCRLDCALESDTCEGEEV
jgi:UDP-glucose 4-epimerase